MSVGGMARRAPGPRRRAMMPHTREDPPGVSWTAPAYRWRPVGGPAGPSAEGGDRFGEAAGDLVGLLLGRSEEHTSELQSLMSNSYAVFCLDKKTHRT